MAEIPEGFRPVSPPIPEGFRLVGEPQEESDNMFERALQTINKPLQQFAQGLSAGTSDEIIALLTAPAAAASTGTSIGDAFNEILESERLKQEEFREENPKTAFGLELLGGIGTGGAGGAKVLSKTLATETGKKILTGAATRGGRVAQGAGRKALAGAPIGAAFGAGTAEGGIEERVKGAVVGGTTAAALTPLAQPVIAAGVGTLKLPARLARGLTRVLSKTEDDQANLQIGRAIQRDGLTDTNILQAKKELGPVANFADSAGESARLELERVAASPGGGRSNIVETLKGRLTSQRERVTQEIRKAFTPEHSTFDAQKQAIIKEASAKAAPLYEKAYSTPIDNSSPGMKVLIRNPRIKKAFPEAIENLKSKTIDPDDPNAKLLEGLIDNLDPENPSLLLWDHVKRALDDKRISAFISGNRSLSKDIGDNLKQLRKQLDIQSPEYGQARKIWGGGQESVKAFELGTSALKNLTNLEKGGDATIKLADDFSDAAKRVYRNGLGLRLENMVRTAPDTQAGTPGASLLSQIFGNPEKRRIINHAIPDSKGFIRGLSAERQFAKSTNDILTNSRTALREALKKESRASSTKIGGDLIRAKFALEGNMFAQLGLASEALLGRKVPEGVNRATAKKLLETEGAKMQQTLRDIDKLVGIPESLKTALNMKSPVQVSRYFLDNKAAANEFNQYISAVLAGMTAGENATQEN